MRCARRPHSLRRLFPWPLSLAFTILPFFVSLLPLPIGLLDLGICAMSPTMSPTTSPPTSPTTSSTTYSTIVTLSPTRSPAMSPTNPPARLVEQAPITYTSYPHIVETIVDYSDYATLLRFRATCSSLKTKARQNLCNGSLEVELCGTFIPQGRTLTGWGYGVASTQRSMTGAGRRGSEGPEVVLRTELGVLPFDSEEEWAWAFAQSHSIEIDGACLSRAADGPPQDPPSRISHPLQARLHRAMLSISRSAAVRIYHSRFHGPPAFLPHASNLTISCDPGCDCLGMDYGDGPPHTATHITLLVPDQWQRPLDDDDFKDRCQFAWCATKPPVERLTISTRLAGYLGNITDTLARERRRLKEPDDLELEVILRCHPNDQRSARSFPGMVEYMNFKPDRARLTYDPAFSA